MTSPPLPQDIQVIYSPMMDQSLTPLDFSYSDAQTPECMSTPRYIETPQQRNARIETLRAALDYDDASIHCGSDGDLSKGDRSNEGSQREGDQSNEGGKREGDQSNEGGKREGDRSNEGGKREGDRSNEGGKREGDLISEGAQSGEDQSNEFECGQSKGDWSHESAYDEGSLSGKVDVNCNNGRTTTPDSDSDGSDDELEACK